MLRVLLEGAPRSPCWVSELPECLWWAGAALNPHSNPKLFLNSLSLVVKPLPSSILALLPCQWGMSSPFIASRELFYGL